MDEIMEMLCESLKMEFAKGIENVDTHEAGMVVDMIKDLAEAKYHCAVVEAMENGESIPYTSATVSKGMINDGRM